MKLGIIYAGQGSQVVGMGKSFYPHEIFDQNEDLKELCFNGPLEKLSYTPYTQPCMVMVDLARFRGKVMQEAVSEIESEMIAVLGMKEELLQDLCHQASSLGVVSISNYNCPGQLVVAGEKKAVEKVKELALENKARRVIALNTSGPFHTSLLKEASLALKERFKKETFHEMKIPVIFNTLGHEIECQSIPEILEKQVMSPVYFEKSIRYMIDQGVDTIIEVGPGKVLSGFVRKIDRSIQLYQIEDMESLKKTVKALKGE